MSEINISIFSRLLSAYLQERSDVQGVVRNVMAAADGDGQPNEEDHVLTDVEARAYIERQQEQGRTIRRRLSFLTSRRDALVGTLQGAQETLRRAGAPEEVLRLVRNAVELDEDNNNLSLPELREAISHLETTASQLERLNAGAFFQEVEGMVRDLRELERERPEILFPETETAQRASIDLNFLKGLEEGDWRQINQLRARAASGEEAQPTNTQERFYMTVLTLINVAGIDVANRGADWRLSFENLQAALGRLPPPEDGHRDSPELTMAEFRYAADAAQEDMGRIQGQRLLSHPERTELGVSLRPLITGRPEIFSQIPSLQLYRDEAGEDGIMTLPELARSLRHMYASSGGTPPDPATLMNELRVLVTAHQPETPVAAATGARGGDPFIRELNRLVLDDLGRMRDGFTERDRQLVDTMEAWDLIPRLVSNIVTLGGLTTGGNTYVEVRQGFAEMAATRRNNALAALRSLIDHPDGEPAFQRFLAGRSGADAQVSIPNALAYLRQTNAETAALLDGSFFQASRLWNIRRDTDVDRQARSWLSFASDLRGGYRGDGVTSVIHAVPNLAFSRAILHAVRRESTNPAIRSEARRAFQDSMGYELTDDSGNRACNNITCEGNGELGLWPVDWFRNYPDEATATVASDAVFIGASFVGGGAAFRGFRGLLTAVGRRELMVGLTQFAGMRSTALLEAASAGSAAANSPGMFGRWLANSAARRISSAEARVAAATSEAELTAARSALARAQNVQRILTSPLVQEIAGGTSSVNQLVGDALTGAGRSLGGLGYGLRGLGYGMRGLGWVVGEGIPRYAIASQLFNRFARRHRFPLILDRQYNLNLPEAPASAGTSAAGSRTAAVVHPAGTAAGAGPTRNSARAANPRR